MKTLNDGQFNGSMHRDFKGRDTQNKRQHNTSRLQKSKSR